jgi:hypothetical protein
VSCEPDRIDQGAAVAVATPQALRLARRLRDLRESHWPEVSLTQVELARAFSHEQRVASATLSSWESVSNPKPPPASRLRAYALFFSTQRSVEGSPHLLAEKDLTVEEREAFKTLEAELLDIYEATRPASTTTSTSAVSDYTWDFHDGSLTIICPEPPASAQGALASTQDPNYTRMSRYADLDALFELYGHVRAANPEMEIAHRLPSEIVADDLSNHVVLLGGSGWNRVAGRLLKQLHVLPISQIEVNDVPTGEIFRASGPGGGEFYPSWEEREGGRELVEDVGFLARVANPYNSKRTLTICNGIHSRGVLGSVRALTDKAVRDANEGYLAERFSGGDFGLLMRVPVLENEAISPDLLNPAMRLYEWSAQDEVESR